MSKLSEKARQQAEREARLAEKLRVNLRRRKAVARKTKAKSQSKESPET